MLVENRYGQFLLPLRPLREFAQIFRRYADLIGQLSDGMVVKQKFLIAGLKQKAISSLVEIDVGTRAVFLLHFAEKGYYG